MPVLGKPIQVEACLTSKAFQCPRLANVEVAIERFLEKEPEAFGDIVTLSNSRLTSLESQPRPGV